MLLFSTASRVHARHIRPLFEPTDLEIDQPGVIDLDLQIGMARSEDDAWRIVVPDFEVDLGLLPNVELDVDGAYAIEGSRHGLFSFDHPAPDTLWVSGKIGFYDVKNDPDQRAFAFGMQLGPKLPVAPIAHGVGIEGVFLAATNYKIAHAVWNAGGFVDSAADRGPSRPTGIEVDLDLDLDADQAFSLDASVSGVHFLSSDADQILTSAGVTWSVSDALDLSLCALVGWLAGGDRYGALLGV
ncbi:MAG TPA: hypothetical protein VHZ95_20185, partial [Polyangiales bacterium]|nr:hypothetical protein [Polyangiales bacterium]